MGRSYYSSSVARFLSDGSDQILGILCREHSFSVDEFQRNAWIDQIQILKAALCNIPSAHLMFEYSIPRMGKRVDNILLYRGIIFVIEFKDGDKTYPSSAKDQVFDYAMDLKNFHEQSHHKVIVPVLVSTEAPAHTNQVVFDQDHITKIILCNKDTLGTTIQHIAENYSQPDFSYMVWEKSIYKPTPTIIEAAQALYQGHDVKEISRCDGGAVNLSLTASAINQIIDFSKTHHRKSICFVTGVPGAGKTLAGLNIANQRHAFEQEEHAVFLSGNLPLVKVLQEALARNDTQRNNLKIGEARTKAQAFIQAIHNFRDDAIKTTSPPIEKVVVFDEAQRAWTKEQTAKFMKKKKRMNNFNQSEPNFLISIMDRHQQWATIICLVGGGQEINKGEAGLPEWFAALRENYAKWNVYVSPDITQDEYTRGEIFSDMVAGLQVKYNPDLHLRTSIRSFRSEHVSLFVKHVLDNHIAQARQVYGELSEKYPIVITRSLDAAKQWLRKQARGTERIGVIASSGASRLKPYGLCTQIKIKACDWFLNSKDDVRSSYYLENVATEFEVQGLELDWTCVAWDANLRYNGQWIYKKFVGTKWQQVNHEEGILYLKNAYRVLLTRARQGMVLFIPEGDWLDRTRSPAYYDGIYDLFLNQIGMKAIQ